MPNKTAGETECPAAPPEAPPPSRTWALKLLVPILILAAWDLTVRFGDVSPFIIPSPWDILREFYDNMLNGRLPLQIFISLKRSLGGFLLGSALGIFLGVIMGWSRVWNLLFDLAVNFIRSVPKTALAPLFLIWFGLGDLSKVLLIAFSSFFFTVIPTIEGVKNVDHTYIKSARSMGADNLQVLLTVVLPAALPSIFAGVRLAVTTSLLVLVMVEIIAGSDGLGFLLEESRTNLDMALLFATLSVLGLLGYGLDAGMQRLARVLMPWRKGKTISL